MHLSGYGWAGYDMCVGGGYKCVWEQSRYRRKMMSTSWCVSDGTYMMNEFVIILRCQISLKLVLKTITVLKWTFCIVILNIMIFIRFQNH